MADDKSVRGWMSRGNGLKNDVLEWTWVARDM